MVHYIYDIVLMEPSEEEVAYTNTLGKICMPEDG